MQQPITNIYIDLDGVITDFNRQFQSLETNKSKLLPYQYIKKYNDETFWSLIKPFGIPFWSKMKWKLDGQDLLQWIHKHTKGITKEFLSTPSEEKESEIGKKIWIKNMTHNCYPLILSKEKFKYATPTSILIDDYDKNIKEWIKAGGIGILHINTKDTIKQLKEYL